jgi:CBS domain-containing protein
MMSTVADWMTTDVVVVTPDEHLSDALRKLHRNRIRHLCVVGAGGELAGMLSDRDILRALPSTFAANASESYERLLEAIHVGQVMTRALLLAAPETLLNAAAERMLVARVSALPVLEGGALVGILTETDCLRALCRREVRNAHGDRDRAGTDPSHRSW